MSSPANHLAVFGAVALVAWGAGTCAFLYYQPQLFYRGVRRAALRGLGLKSGALPVNTIRALPDLASPALSKSSLMLTGNRDTLYAFGALDLAGGPLVLHVPEITGRYYSVELFGPWLDVVGIVGRRTTGTRAGDYLVAGPAWDGAVPAGMTKIASPGNSLLVLARVLVEGEADVPAAYALARQIQVAPLAGR